MAEDVERIYEVEDEVVEESGDSFSDALDETYFANFNALMPTLFSEEFAAELRDAVKAVREIPSDEFFVKQQAKETLDTEMVRKESIFEIRFLRMYAAKAYVDQPGIYDEFNFPGLGKVRDSNQKMQNYLSDLIKVVEKHIATLTAADYPVTKVDELKQLLIDLERERDEQKSIIRERARLTIHRVKALNHLWALMKEVSEVREFALPGDPEGQEIFKLPQRNVSQASEESEEI